MNNLATLERAFVLARSDPAVLSRAAIAQRIGKEIIEQLQKPAVVPDHGRRVILDRQLDRAVAALRLVPRMVNGDRRDLCGNDSAVGSDEPVGLDSRQAEQDL